MSVEFPYDADKLRKIPQPYWREQPYQIGPTLRQRYAMAAMQSLLQRGWLGSDDCGDNTTKHYSEDSELDSTDVSFGRETLAADAFAIADAMLAHEAKEREVKP